MVSKATDPDAIVSSIDSPSWRWFTGAAESCVAGLGSCCSAGEAEQAANIRATPTTSTNHQGRRRLAVMPEIYALRRTCRHSPDGGQSRLLTKETSNGPALLSAVRSHMINFDQSRFNPRDPRLHYCQRGSSLCLD